MTLAAVRCLAAASVLLLPRTLQSQDQRKLEHPRAAERRIALVIGNDAYRHVEPLQNAVADARAIGVELRQLGFEVMIRENVDRRGLNKALVEFVGRLSADSMALLYFAGHGVQIRGGNYLLPIDLDAQTEDDVAYDALDLSHALERITEAQVAYTLAIVDACRNNPFKGTGGRGVGAARGLAPPTSTPKGFVVVYSAGANESALDRLGPGDTSPNGLFTRQLLPLLREPGITVSEAVRRLKAAVSAQAKAVGRDQHPAIYDQSTGDFYFSSAGAAPSAAATPAPSGDGGMQLEIAFWSSISGSRNPKDYEEYLSQFPAGRFAGLARTRLDELRGAGRPVAGASDAMISVKGKVVNPGAYPFAAGMSVERAITMAGGFTTPRWFKKENMNQIRLVRSVDGGRDEKLIKAKLDDAVEAGDTIYVDEKPQLRLKRF
jgi:uncharacterized caspase-like protein